MKILFQNTHVTVVAKLQCVLGIPFSSAVGSISELHPPETERHREEGTKMNSFSDELTVHGDFLWKDDE